MISIGFDTSAWDYFDSDMLDYMFFNKKNSNINIHLYPSNIDELIQGISFNNTNYLKNCPKLKYFNAKKIEVICGSWRKDIDYLIGKISPNGWEKERKNIDKIVRLVVNRQYPYNKHKEVLKNRNWNKAYLSAYLLKLRITPYLILWLARFEQAEKINDNVNMEIANKEYTDLRQAYNAECSGFKNMSIEELNRNNTELKGQAPRFKNDDKREFIEIFRTPDLRLQVLKDISSAYADSELIEIDSISRNTDIFKSLNIFLISFWSLLINYVWGCIAEPSTYNIDNIMDSIISDAEMVGYVAKCKTDIFITNDKVQFSTSEVIFNKILAMRTRVIYISGSEKNKQSLLNQIFTAKTLNESIFMSIENKQFIFTHHTQGGILCIAFYP